jgi:hypothetical protein
VNDGPLIEVMHGATVEASPLAGLIFVTIAPGRGLQLIGPPSHKAGSAPWAVNMPRRCLDCVGRIQREVLVLAVEECSLGDR